MGVESIPSFPVENFYVYAMFCQDDPGKGFVKIGHSKDIGNRLSQLRTGSPIQAQMFAIVLAGHSKRLALSLEKRLHKKFADRRVRGEWFRFDFDSDADKQIFNVGCREVFSGFFRPEEYEYWTKISVAALDAYAKERQKQYLKSKHRRKIKGRQKAEQDRRRAWRELGDYGSAA